MSRPTLLLLEDDELQAELIRRMLGETAGDYCLEIHSTFESARSSLQGGEVSLLLVDYHLPGVWDGIRVIRHLRELGWRRPAVLLTQDQDPHVDELARQAGASDFLLKSELSSRLLDRVIRYALHREAMEQALGKAQAEIQRIVTTMDDVVWSAEADSGRLVYISPAARSLYGRSIDCFVHLTDLWVEPVVESDRSVACWDHRGDRVDVRDVTYQIVHADGHIRCVRERTWLSGDSGESGTMVHGLISNISELVGVQQKLEQQMALESLLAEMTGRLIRQNSEFESTCQWACQELVQMLGLVRCCLLYWPIHGKVIQQVICRPAEDELAGRRALVGR